MSLSFSRYLNIRMAYAPSVRSDGQQVAFLTNITGIPQAWAVDTNSPGFPWPEQLTFSTDRVLNARYSPAPGDNRLIFSHDIGGNENAQLFLLTENEEIPLTQGHENAMHIFGSWSHDGSTICFAANRRHPGRFDIYIQPLDGEAELIWQAETPGYPFRQAFSPDGSKLVFNVLRSSFTGDLFLLDLQTGKARQLNADQAQVPAIYHGPAFSQDGKSLYLITDQDHDFLYLARLDLENRELEVVWQLDWDIENLALSLQGDKLAFTINNQGYQRVYLYTPDCEELRPCPPLDEIGGTAAFFDGQLTFSTDGKQLFFSYSSSTRTPDLFAWDLETDTARQLTRSSHGGIPLDSFEPYELIHYPTFDERQIPAWLCLPKDSAGPVPVVVIVHGGPESQTQPYFNLLAQYFVQHGFAILAPNVRGSTGYGKTYAHLDDVELRMDSVADLAHAAQWLKSQPERFDPARVAVYGGSYGGFMVLSALTTYPELWAAGVNIVGISNFVTFLENTSQYRRAHREAEYGSLANDREFLARISPINHIDKLTAPLLVIHGANDPRVPLGEAEQLVAALEARGVPVELLVFDDEGHGIVKLKNKLVAYPSVVSFLQAHLG